jgi:hypothetical protein
MNLQAVVAILIVLGAAFFIGRRLWRSAKGKSDGSCDKCGPMEGRKGK